MVYESDFYTTRRPYTSSRPTITSYSVTRREVPWHKVPSVPRPSQIAPCFTVFGSRYLPGQTFHRNIPHVAHKRLVVVGPSAHAQHLKQSAYLAEIDRIYHKVRPSLAYQPTEDYLNSRSMVSFDDETRSIRAKTAEILKRIHTPIPRAQRPMPLPGDAYYSHSELPITERISSDNYIDRLLSANKEVQHNVLTMSHYDEPARHYNSIGKGHLACVSFAGGRPISKRRNLASADDYIRDDINVLSHYGRFRAAANGVPHVPDTEYAPIPHRPPTKSSVTGSWKSNAPHKTDKGEAGEREPHIKANLTAGEEFDAALDTKKRRREAIEAAALREAEEEKRRKQELERQEELAQQAALERQEELERKARQEEEARRLKEEEEIIARENAERLAAEKKSQAEAEKKAREEEERRAKEEAERLAKEEEERKAQEEAERLVREEEERKAKEEAERKAKEEEERKAKEEAERKAKEEEERKAKEEAERLAKEEEERKAKEEAERLAKEEEERKAKEEAERLAKEEEERLAKEEEERKAEEERLAKQAAEDAVAESEAEPVVEEPQSPEDAPVENTDQPAAEEVEEEEEEEEE